MDANSHGLSHRYSISPQNVEDNGGTVRQAEAHDMIHCIVCGRTFVPFIGVNEGPDSITVCIDCKSFLMDDYDSTSTPINSSRNQRRITSAYGSSESIENALSQQFSQLIGLVRRDLQLDDDVRVSGHQHSRYSSLRNWSTRVHRSHSETDNDSIDIMDSLFGETNSHISFGGFGGDSDASVDREILSPLDYESRTHTDTDIDPMQAGIDQWTSDGEWEDTPIQLTESALSPQVLWGVRGVDLFTDLDEIDLSPFTGNSGDYMDAHGFEELLEQLAEADSSRIGAPPAAVSSLENLPRVIVSKDDEKNGSLICAVCKEPLSIGSEAKQLPCSHIYHPSCILPWLRTRNSCPVCRYELPTDDLEYEKGKQNSARNGIQDQEAVDESYSDGSGDPGDQGHEDEHTDGSDDVHGGNGRWLFIVAAPVVAIIGIAIAALLRNSMTGRRIQIPRGVRDRSMQYQRSPRSVAHENRSRSWWSFY